MRRVTTPAALVLVLVACGGGEPDQVPDYSRPAPPSMPWLAPLPPEYVLGDDAPDFQLPVLTADAVGPDSIRLSALRGRVVLLNFWNTGCVPCVAEHETINRVADWYRERGVRYLGINNGDTPATLALFERKHGPARYPQLADAADSVGKAYERFAWPLHVAIDPQGRVVWWRHGGPLSEDVLVSVVEDVLAGRRPRAQLHAAFPDS